MNPLLNGFAILAALGFILSLVSHIAALIRMPGPLGDFTWILHLGIFVVWIPAAITSNIMGRNSPRKDFWKVALRGCPPWMRYAFYAIIGYAILNFIFFLITAPSGHSPSGGSMPPSVVRGFSGHWMVFYFAGFAILYSKTHGSDQGRPAHCPNGHPINASAKYCETCGAPIFQTPITPK